MTKWILAAALAALSTAASAQYYGGSGYSSNSYRSAPSYGTRHDTYVYVAPANPYRDQSYDYQQNTYRTDTSQDEYYRTQSHINTYSTQGSQY